jgi:DNA polymerase zeta
VYSRPPPSASSLLETLSGAYGLPAKIYQDPYYSNPAGQNTRLVEVAGVQGYIPGPGISWLPDWAPNEEGNQSGDLGVHRSPQRPRPRVMKSGGHRAASKLIPGWTFADEPPGRAEIRKWLIEHAGENVERKAAFRSQARVCYLYCACQANLLDLWPDHGTYSSYTICSSETKTRSDAANTINVCDGS